MRIKRYFALLIAVLSCSMVLVSCDAITAQKITSTDSGSRANGDRASPAGGGKMGADLPA